ncbi:MAG: hypothetical protein ACRD1C_01925 [Terriglobales bacterium]
MLVLRVRADGNVRAMRVAMRGSTLTFRRSAGLLDDGNAARVYGDLFRRAKFDSICCRIFRDGHWINPLEVGDDD